MQTINLLTNLPRRKTPLITFKQFVLANACCCLFLVLLQSALVLHLHRLQSVYTQAQNASGQHLAQKNMLVCDWKMASLFESLSSHIPHEVWLTDIESNANGKEITLRGHAYSNDILQAFMSTLNQMPEFNQVHFILQDVTQTQAALNKQAPANSIDFVLHRQVTA